MNRTLIDLKKVSLAFTFEDYSLSMMHRIKAVLAIGLVLVVCLGGCKEKVDPPGVTLSAAKLVDGVYEAAENETVTIQVNVEAPGGVQFLRVTFEGIDRAPEDMTPASPGTSSFETMFTLSDWTYPGEDFDIVFTAIDGSEGTSSARITVAPGLPSIEILESISIENDTLFAETGRYFQFRYRYVFPGGLNRFTRTLYSDAEKLSEVVVTTLPPTQGTSVTEEITQDLGTQFLGTSLNYTLEIVDKFGESATTIIPLILEESPAVKFTNLNLSSANTGSNSDSFLSVREGVVYSTGEVLNDESLAELIDFGFYYDDIDSASLAGPANYPTSVYNVGPNGDNWNPLNVANFKRTTLTVADFEALEESSQEEIESIYESAEGEAMLVITRLQAREVIAFKIRANEPLSSQYGVLIVANRPTLHTINIDLIR